MLSIAQHIATELTLSTTQVEAAIALLDEGATVPFIARYRKEVTQGMDDVQLRHMEERLVYLRELEDRRQVIRKQIEEQGKLSPELAQQIDAADAKTRLEDLYLPYKQKRRTKAQRAREAGLDTLAQTLLENPAQSPEATAQSYVDPNKEVPDVAAALEGARQILMENFAEDAGLLGRLREYVWEHAVLQSAVLAAKEKEGAKFTDYFDFQEAIKKIPSHRALAMFRGRKDKILQLRLRLPEELDPARDKNHPNRCELMIAQSGGISDQGRAADHWLNESVRWAWRVKLSQHLEVELKTRLREQAELEAIQVFAANLRDLLLAAPAGSRVTMGLDPGLRTGVKVVVVDATGKLLDSTTIYPHVPRQQWDASIATLAQLAERHAVDLVSIGNGTASRETDRLVAEVIRRHPKLGLHKVLVSEAGASVYSASALASEEFPDLDVSLRGGVSIARRLQDPLAELVKIDPKSIGVGQYQHDVNQTRLSRMLNTVVEDCVNAVGVDVNTASAPLLERVAGLSTTLASRVVAHRDANGPFQNRRQLLKVPRLGEKAFEQCAGFLRIRAGDNPLDASGVHPEAYPVVERIQAAKQCALETMLGNSAFLGALDPAHFTDDIFGTPTVRDILLELEKPGRDPRPDFKTAQFKEGVEKIQDVSAGMVLEGTVSNVTHFGAFVDIGVHQDGLIHISCLSHSFVTDPRELVKVGDVVKVKVLSLDVDRRRIALSLRLDDPIAGQEAPPAKEKAPTPQRQRRPAQQKTAPQAPMEGAMAAAFARLR